MSRILINRNADLKRLVDDGYEVEIRANYLLVKNIPYVNETKTIQRGTLVSELTLDGDSTVTPHTHVVMFTGDMPCDGKGLTLNQIHNSSNAQDLGEGVKVNHTFSRKPEKGYVDFHHKMVTYERIVSEPARSIEPGISAQTFTVLESQDENSVFKYVDTASSRAGIGAITEKLKVGPIAIVGLGGTGSYILDLVAKTPVREIHLFDGDKFRQHNAFRSPGAAPIDALKATPMKAEYFRNRYSELREGIVSYGYVDESNVHCLRNMDFVFIAVDNGSQRKLVVDKLYEFGVPFIDVGMGVLEVESSLRGQLRVTSSLDQSHDQVHLPLPLVESDGEVDYSRNIQIADLNALNAAVAVITWKRILGFYANDEEKHSSVYLIKGNMLVKSVKT